MILWPRASSLAQFGRAIFAICLDWRRAQLKSYHTVSILTSHHIKQNKTKQSGWQRAACRLQVQSRTSTLNVSDGTYLLFKPPSQPLDANATNGCCRISQQLKQTNKPSHACSSLINDQTERLKWCFKRAKLGPMRDAARLCVWACHIRPQLDHFWNRAH
jgi:hypothetical protein